MRLALYEPDIPQNTGTILRLAACFGIAVDIIEPCGFRLDDRSLRRAGLDYLEQVRIERHSSWHSYSGARRTQPLSGRLVLLTTKGDTPHHEFAFRDEDTLLLGRESAGVPEAVHAAADASLVVPMRAGLRSLNVAVTAAMVLGEALRQTDLFPKPAVRTTATCKPTNVGPMT